MAVNRTFEVRGMDCTGCEAVVGRALERLDGVITVRADQGADRVDVRFDPARVSDEQIRERIREAGYETSSGA